MGVVGRGQNALNLSGAGVPARLPAQPASIALLKHRAEALAACGGTAGARAKARRSVCEAGCAPSALQEDARATEA